MALRVTFAEQSTGTITTMAGPPVLSTSPCQHVEDMWEALTLARDYLENHPGHEAWIGSSVSAHRLALPYGRGFDSWIAQFRLNGSLGAVRTGLTYGEVVSMLGWPDGCSIQLNRSPLNVILRYQPKDVDFHFDDDGRLMLVHQDDLADPMTLLHGE